ncbi:hypothetical protein YPPY47_3316, partial [Yersinia pestis PY-47]
MNGEDRQRSKAS